MDRPIHRFIAVLTSVGACAVVGTAADEESRAERRRPISPRTAEMLSAAMPKFEPIASSEVTDQRAGLRAKSPDQPANGLVRLPQYIVREPKLPAPHEVMTRSAREKFAMQKYLGDENGLERTLNMFSISGLWAKIPVLGKYPFVVGQFQGRHSGLAVGPMTNAQRALEQYEKDKTAERWEQLSGLMSPQLKPATPAPKETPPPAAP
jgi:hypothetical protein